MHLMFFAGADSVDSSGWRIKAAYGAIQLPGKGDRYITIRKRHKKYRDLSKIEEKSLDHCGCPICKKDGVKKLREDFCARALHNSWVYQKEIEKVRRLIKERSYEDYIEEVLSKSFFSKAFAFAKNLRNS